MHMNGRIYDPLLGRFLSADPYIQYGQDLQSYNRYSYVLNNPLRYTDPTGYLTKSEHQEEIDKLKAQIEANKKKYTKPRGANRSLKKKIGQHKGAIKRIDRTAKFHNAIVDALAFVTGTDKSDAAHLKIDANKLDDESKEDAVFFKTGDKIDGLKDEAIATAATGVAGKLLARSKVVAKGIDTIEDTAGTGSRRGKNPRRMQSQEPFEENMDPAPFSGAPTGRTTANNLTEQLAMKQAKSSPAGGEIVPLKKGMTDTRWPASDGWVKMRQNVNGVEIHYVRNTKTGAVDDFKFK